VRIVEKDLGAIIKTARKNRGLTQEDLAEKAGVGTRHIMSIENEGGNPSYDVLYMLIRELHIPSDSIFYPERAIENPLLEEVIRVLYDCDSSSLKIISATAKAALENQKDKN